MSDERTVQLIIEEIYAQPMLVNNKGKNAARLVQEHFTAAETTAELGAVLSEVRVLPAVRPVLGEVHVVSRYLTSVGSRTALALCATRPTLEEIVLVPADNIFGLELSYSLPEHFDAWMFDSVHIEVKRETGIVLVRQRIPSHELNADGRIQLSCSRLSPLRGGERITCSIRLEFADRDVRQRPAESPLLYFQGVQGPGLLTQGAKGTAGSQAHLALYFLPGGSRLFRLRRALERVFFLVAERDWQQLASEIRGKGPFLLRALRRLPTLMLEPRRG